MRHEEFNGMVSEELVRIVAGASIDTNNNSLSELSNMSIEQLTSIKGVGEKTAKKLLAAFELGRRVFAEEAHRKAIYSSNELYMHLRPLMQNEDVETAYIVIMNHGMKVLKTIKLSEGGRTETLIDVRVALKHVLLNNGTVVALAHNHPSGNLRPSSDDDRITEQFAKACKVMRIFFMDHIIIGDGYYSYHDMGKL